MIISFF